MTYKFPLDPAALFEERTNQFINLGLPAEAVDEVRSRITDMWSNEPGGWVHEWSRLAADYERQGEHFLAALAYGGAKFPSVTDDARRTALAKQVDQYVKAAPTFPVSFQRRWVPTTYRGSEVEVPVHILTPPGSDASTPVLIASGGIDTWKMDLHPMYVALALGAGVRVVGFEHPGVGELTDHPLTPAGTELVDGLLRFARGLTTGRVGHFGLSFGGYFSASSGLRGVVDAAIVLGGPVTSRSFGDSNLTGLLYGMENIFGNAVGFSRQPTQEELLDAAGAFPLDGLLESTDNAPMLVINGDADIHVPASDARVFEGRPSTQVELISDGSHCALNKIDELLPILVRWTKEHLQA